MSGFVLLFLFRLVYSYSSSGDRGDGDAYISDFFDGFDASQVKRNYASDSYRYKKEYSESKSETQVSSAPLPPSEVSVDQKYEKTATVKSRSQNFESDEKKIKSKIKGYNGIIQFEQNTGGAGNRELHLLIGIQPEKFDSFYIEMKKIGTLKETDIVKVDKTSEYKNLNAKRTSLEKIRQSLIELKNQSGKIDEFINLQNRILEIEEQLQDLGVQLGDFSEENEFCTVRFSLVEGRGPSPISLMHRLKVSFEWTLTYYALFLLVITLASFSGFFILLIIDKLKLLSGTIKKLNE
jgi:hypothetical protein